MSNNALMITVYNTSGHKVDQFVCGDWSDIQQGLSNAYDSLPGLAFVNIRVLESGNNATYQIPTDIGGQLYDVATAIAVVGDGLGWDEAGDNPPSPQYPDPNEYIPHQGGNASCGVGSGSNDGGSGNGSNGSNGGNAGNDGYGGGNDDDGDDGDSGEGDDGDSGLGDIPDEIDPDEIWPAIADGLAGLLGDL